MSTTANTDLGKVIVEALNAEVMKRCEAAFEAKKAELITELEAQKDEVIANTAVRMSRMFSVDTLEDNIRITFARQDLRQ
jgi:hypothetical protein